MANNDEVALFVDLENIVTSLWNLHHQAPDPKKWVEKALQYGPMSFSRAYGDFAQAPLAQLQSRLTVAGIDAFSCPVKVRDGGSQSTVDINVAIDLYEVAMDRPAIGTFILMAGDRDYIRIVTRLRHRLGKRVIIAGVPGSVSLDLVAAAGEADPIVPAMPLGSEGEAEVIRLIDRYESSRYPGTFPTFRKLSEYIRHPSNSTVIDPAVVDAKLNDFVIRGILLQQVEELESGGQLKSTVLDRSREEVQVALR